eukprot:TRINITY_DN1877_c0_g1_i1.p1 TRINITY_DN1877_c0_g1~~TRINITY_DN1877_c0_g1_i1.p1  ORF type:complete len:890 (+),score=253.53 TRINITY_DN1877_c0_g1_i1:81-2672(+)
MAQDGFTDAELAEIKAQFDSFDTDKSGDVDASEIGNLLSKVGEKPTKEEVLKIMKEVDTDNSGKIDFNEFLVVVKKVRANKQSGFGRVVQKDRDLTAMQKKTYTIWCNVHLAEKAMKINDLFNDFKDGVMLINLMMALTGDQFKVGKYNPAPKMQIQAIENCSMALKAMHAEGIRLVNIGPQDINSGTPSIILGLIWTLIQTYQLSEAGEGAGGKAGLLAWVHKQLERYPEVELPQNFSQDWRDGNAMASLVHSLTPTFPHNTIAGKQPIQRHDLAFQTAHKDLTVPLMLEPEDMLIDKPDENSIMTYVSLLKKAQERQREKRGMRPDAYQLEAPKSAVAGTPVHVKIAVAKPQAAKATADAFEAVAITAGGETIPLKIRSPAAGEGTGFHAEFVPLAAGANKIAVRLNGEDITGSPHVLTVAEGRASEKTSGPVGGAVPAAMANLPGSFNVQARDALGNNLKQGREVFVAELQGPAGTVPCKVKDNGDGTYAVSYTAPPKAGAYNLVMGLQYPSQAAYDETQKQAAAALAAAEGMAVPEGSHAKQALAALAVPSQVLRKEPDGAVVMQLACCPCAVQISAGPDPAHSLAAGAALKGATVGVPATFTIETKDGNGAPVAVAGLASQLACTVTGPSGKSVAVPPSDIVDKGDGKYDCTFTPSEVGPNTVAVTLFGAPIAGSPYVVPVTAGPTDALHTTAEGDGLTQAVEGGTAHFVIKTADALGNPRGSGGDVFDIVLTEPSGKTTQGKAVDNGNGTYNCSYVPQESGPHTLAVTLQGKPIANSPWKPHVLTVEELLDLNAKLMDALEQVRRHRNGLMAAVDDDKGAKGMCECGLPNTFDCSSCKKTFNTKEWLQGKFPDWKKW